MQACAYRKLNPGILMMQSAENRMACNTSNFLGGATHRCILAQCQMSASAVVVVHVRQQHVAQMPLSEYHDMINAFPTD
jgi:hypothetical protein